MSVLVPYGTLSQSCFSRGRSRVLIVASPDAVVCRPPKSWMDLPGEELQIVASATVRERAGAAGEDAKKCL